jgi:enamine deaminase RidA (YjgF/YER057c/UK114 family)
MRSGHLAAFSFLFETHSRLLDTLAYRTEERADGGRRSSPREQPRDRSRTAPILSRWQTAATARVEREVILSTSTASSPDDRLRGLGSNPLVASAGAPYRPWRRIGSTLYTSGQIARDGGELVAKGKLGETVSLEQGQACARQTAINTLLTAQAALGTLDAVRALVKITVFVASTAEFTQQPLVANAASDVFNQVLGETGAHARSAIGVASLPQGTPVELEAIFEVRAGRPG